jgi:hypothetical protein
MQDLINSEFGLLLLLTIVVWGGFFAYLMYIFSKMNNLKKEVNSLKALEQDN